MERIAPLAKILAEANGIDWQALRGSGEGGMVVEQDILNYLSRIMSGEEEPPATPVDVPPADWNGDVNAMPDLSGMSSEQLSRAGVDSDIAALLNRPQPSPQVPATPATPELDEEMEFELDDEVAPAAAPLAPTAAPAMPTWDFSAPAPQAAPVPEPVPTPVPEVQMPELQVAEAPAPAAAAGLGSLLSRLYQQTPAPAAPPSPAESAPTLSQPSHRATASLDEAAPDAGALHPENAHSGAPHASYPVSDHTDSAEEQPALAAEPVVMDTPATERVPTEASSTEASTASDDLLAPEPVAPAAEQAEMQTGPELQAAPEAAAQPEPASPVAAAAPEAAAPAAGAVWFGTYLRRSVDLGAASTLRGQLSSALGREVPLAFLVARAAQRHAAGLGLTSVALQSGEANRARSVAGEHLRAAVDALAHTYEGTPDLLVVDAGALDLDDLHYPHTVTLSVGRVQDGRAALTLNGPVDAAQGARFLADLDATLSEPILLVL